MFLDLERCPWCRFGNELTSRGGALVWGMLLSVNDDGGRGFLNTPGQLLISITLWSESRDN